MKILGIELGSTRIKAVLIDENANVIANGVSEWEKRTCRRLLVIPYDRR